jgi:hypothetical protein
MYRWLLLAIAAIPLLITAMLPAEATGLVWWTTNALEKVRPFDHLPPEAQDSAKIHAARNEFEPFQVILRAENNDISDLDVVVTDLKRSDGAVLPKKFITVFTERYVDLKTASAVDGGTGEWPDPLVPQVDNYTHEKRNAFPLTLLKGRNQPLWVEVYVPRSTAPGSYQGRMEIVIGGKSQASVPIHLEVWNFELPSTSSLVTTYGFSGTAAVRQHYGKYTADSQMRALTHLYRKAALQHRVSIRNGSNQPPSYSKSGRTIKIDWTDYDNQNEPFLNGSVFGPDEPLSGAKVTSESVKTPPSLTTPDDQIQYWQQVAKHFRDNGWFDRLFNYIWDEPKGSDFPAMVKLGETIRRADPKIQNLVTAPLHPEWSGFIDIWAPTLNCFERKPNSSGNYCGVTVARGEYDKEIASGKKLWWYQACGSHGCFIVGGDYYRGWPSYVIDAVGVRNRIQEWMSWKYDIKGELYFQTNEAYGRNKNPWEGQNLNLFGGNGDGTLFYPGAPDVIGGSTHIPIESIRLKLIREGLEDYEYLAALEKLAGRQVVAAKVDQFIRHIYEFDSDPQQLYAIRQWAAEEIQRHSSSVRENGNTQK